jgi:ATP-dependent DNA helicase RecG
MQRDELVGWSGNPEGQFFERKSAFDRTGARRKPRKAADVAWDIVETLSAMANADGGELVVGIEDDGTTSGIPHAEDKIELFLRAAGSRNYVQPPLRFQARKIKAPDGLALLHFVVDWSPEVHRLADSRTLLRVNDANMPFPAEQIAALKQTKAQGLFERSFPPSATLEDLDLDLIERLIDTKSDATDPEKYLHAHRLVQRRNGRSIPCLAALLLFGKDPLNWHPRCGIDFVRWEGTERKHGAELNVTKRFRIEHPLAIILERANEAIRPFIRERQQLHDLFFREKLEYPAFAWQEAIVNAVGHRDYSIQGASIEIWMFDDRIEVRSPGLPPSPVTVEALNRREHLHVSRNPLIVRVLSELGYMRELGEGIPRMFAEMEREGFYPPRFDGIGGVSFQVTLRNQPIYAVEDLKWLGHFKGVALTGDQKRLLLYSHAHGDKFTSREYRKLVGCDIYSASNSIKELIRRGIVQSFERGSRWYQVIEPEKAASEMPAELVKIIPILQERGWVGNSDLRGILGISRNSASRLLAQWTEAGWLQRRGSKRGAIYALGPRVMHHSQNAPSNIEDGA